MSSRLPVYTIVMLVLTLVVLVVTLFAVSDLLEGFGDLFTPREELEERQVAKNAFHNLIYSLESCRAGEDCMCEIYEQSLPTGYSLVVERSGKGSLVKLLEDGSLITSSNVEGIRVGLLEELEKDFCRQSKSVGLVNDQEGWYASKGMERNYFVSGMPEIYKAGKSSACLVTENLLIGSDMSSITGMFSSLPRCSFVAKKMEDAAVSSFNDFMTQLKKCEENIAGQGLGDCLCDFSGIRLPEGYAIQLDASGAIRLVRLKNDASNTTMLGQATFSASSILLEKAFGDVKEEDQLCLASGEEGLSVVEGCSAEAIKSSSLKAYFYSNGSSMLFMHIDTGILKLGTRLIDKGRLAGCVQGDYNLSWPASLSNYLYVSDCFASGELCNPGFTIPLKQGSKVRAAEDGVVEYVNEKVKAVMVRHANGLHTRYGNAIPRVKEGKRVVKGDVIGLVEGGGLLFWVRDDNLEEYDEGKFCPAEGSMYVKRGFDYLNPYCYMGKERDRIAVPDTCQNLMVGCDAYGNSAESKDDYSLRILVIPVNWQRKLSYLMFANDAVEKFVRASPLSKCPNRLKKIFADGKRNYGESWKQGSCIVPNSRNCYSSPVEAVSRCAEEFRSKTGEDYDLVLGVDDSNIALAPDCDFSDRGWTLEGSSVIMVEAQYTGDAVHELGHKFGLKDQYCDCSGTDASKLCGPEARPNPLREELGCDTDADCCKDAIADYPYLEGCRWCQGNRDFKAMDTDDDGTLDSGKRTVMSNLVDSTYYSMDEYFYLKTQPRLQCG